MLSTEPVHHHEQELGNPMEQEMADTEIIQPVRLEKQLALWPAVQDPVQQNKDLPVARRLQPGSRAMLDTAAL